MVELKAAGWVVMDRPGVELYHFSITVRAEYDADSEQWASLCDEFGTASCGDHPVEALVNGVEATVCYLNAIEAAGERKRVFRERAIQVERGLPPSNGSEAVEAATTGALMRVVVAAAADERDLVTA